MGGAVGGAVGFGVSAAAAGLSGYAGGAISGAMSGGVGGFVGGFTGGAGSAWVGGANFGQGLQAGGTSGMYGAFAGTAIGGISGAFQESALRSKLKGGKAPGSMANYLKQAEIYRNSSLRVINDQQLTNILDVSSYDVGELTTAAPDNWGMTTDGIYVDNNGYYSYGATDHYKVGQVGMNRIHISPYALKFAGTSHNYIFNAIAGHELIHAKHWSMFGYKNVTNWRAYGSHYSEFIAWRYSHNVFMNAGDFMNAGEAYGNMIDYL